MAESPGFADIGGVKIGGLITGSGPPLLLLHGFAGSWAEWKITLPTLTRHFKVYVPTMPGHGESGPIPDYSLETARRLFLSFMDSERLEKVYLIGHSMGGLLALDIALNHPDRVIKLVLIDSAGMGSEIHWGLRLLSLPFLGEIVLDFLWPRVWPGIKAVARLVGIDLPDLTVKGTAWRPARGMARLLRAGVGLSGQKLWPSIKKKLPDLKIPTLIIWGERDELFPLSQAIAAHRTIPGSKLYILRGCGHLLPPRCADELSAVLLDFLLRDGRAGARR